MHRKKTIFIASSILACLVFSGCIRTQVRTLKPHPDAAEHQLLVFYSNTCGECIEAKNKLIPQIEKEFGDNIRIEYLDTAVTENYKLLLGLKEKYNAKMELVLPVFYFEGQLISGRLDAKRGLRRIINRALGKSYAEEELPEVDLAERFKSFRAIGIIAAGLVDGINPCAFTVIVFFISFLSLQGYRKKELIAIGSSFILAVFLTYFFIGLGLFNIIYGLEKFLLVRKIFNVVIGISSITLGVLSVYDVVMFKKTSRTEGLILKLPDSVKNQIHKIIGWHYRKPPKGSNRKNAQVHIVKLMFTALVTGFLVSFLELVCTGQLYLPTIKFALKTSEFKLQALTYLVLYNVMFIIPLLAIFLLVLLGVTSEQFSKFLRKHLEDIKILMALLFFGLGIFLLWRP